jgi:hypothetical protein
MRPSISPARNREHHFAQGAAFVRQDVLDANRRLGDDVAMDESLRLKLLEALGEHPVAQAGDRLANIAEAVDAGSEAAKDRSGPATADQLDGALVIRTERVEVFGCHVSILPKVSRACLTLPEAELIHVDNPTSRTYFSGARIALFGAKLVDMENAG